jgi:hypothetical protein
MVKQTHLDTIVETLVQKNIRTLFILVPSVFRGIVVPGNMFYSRVLQHLIVFHVHMYMGVWGNVLCIIIYLKNVLPTPLSSGQVLQLTVDLMNSS